MLPLKKLTTTKKKKKLKEDETKAGPTKEWIIMVNYRQMHQCFWKAQKYESVTSEKQNKSTRTYKYDKKGKPGGRKNVYHDEIQGSTNVGCQLKNTSEKPWNSKKSNVCQKEANQRTYNRNEIHNVTIEFYHEVCPSDVLTPNEAIAEITENLTVIRYEIKDYEKRESSWGMRDYY